MKKLLLFLFSAFIFSTSVSALELVPLTICIEEDEQPGTNGFPRTPITAPTVYTTVVYSTQTQVVLPSSLSGDYEIQLDFGGSYIFVGEIVL